MFKNWFKYKMIWNTEKHILLYFFFYICFHLLNKKLKKKKQKNQTVEINFGQNHGLD